MVVEVVRRWEYGITSGLKYFDITENDISAFGAGQFFGNP